MEKVKARECAICFEQLNNPYIHSGVSAEVCGQSMDYQCIVDSVQKFARCPLCNRNVTMDDFKPNRTLAEVLAEQPEIAVRVVKETSIQIIKETEKAPIAFSPSVEKESKGFSGAMSTIKQLNRQVYNDHVNKDSTKKIRADWGNKLIAIYKSGAWRFYDLKTGGGAFYEGNNFGAGESAATHRV